MAEHEYCKDNGVTDLSFQPHCRYKLKHLDWSVYGSLKTCVNRECDAWITNHPGQTTAIYDLTGIINTSLQLLLQISRQDLRSPELIPTAGMSLMKRLFCPSKWQTERIHPQTLEQLIWRKYCFMSQHRQELTTFILPYEFFQAKTPRKHVCPQVNL